MLSEIVVLGTDAKNQEQLTDSPAFELDLLVECRLHLPILFTVEVTIIMEIYEKHCSNMIESYRNLPFFASLKQH